MRGKREAALRARLRALEAARRLGHEDDVTIHRRAIHQLRKRLGVIDQPASRLHH